MGGPLPLATDITCIVTDIDGTLLDSNHKVHPRTASALSHIRREFPHLPVIIATGKQAPSVIDIRRRFQLHSFPASHLNGGLTYSSEDHLLNRAGLERQLVRRITEIFLDSDVGIYWYDETKVYQLQRPYGNAMDISENLRHHGEDVVAIQADKAILSLDNHDITVYKIGLSDQRAAISSIKQKLLSMGLEKGFSMTQAIPQLLEIIPASTSKGKSLQLIASHLGLDLSRALVFGDGDNDISMFEVAGCTCAVQNAVPGLASVSAFSTDSNDLGGVGHFLEKIFGSASNGS